MKNKKISGMLSIIISLIILFSITVPVFGQASDISGNWAENEITKWTDKGIISGYEDGTYRPQNAITRAEFVSLISRIFAYIEKSDKTFPDVDAAAWFADSVSKAVSSGIILGDGNGNFRPYDPISREEAAIVLSKAFKLTAVNANASDSFADKASIASWSKSYVSALVENKYMSGKPGNLFAPKDNLDRAEAAKLFDNIANELFNEAGTYTGDIDGNLVVSAADVELKDMVIDGDLFIAQGVGDGDVILDGVTVNGRTVVLGGGENSIIIRNSSLVGTLLVIKQDGKVRIVASGSTNINDVKLNSGATLLEEDLTGDGFGAIEIIEVPADGIITLDGDFEEVVVDAPDIVVDITSGTVGNLIVEEQGEDATILIAEGAAVGTLTANAAVNVEGKGTIDTANIKADGVTIEQKPENVIIDEDITAIVDGEEITGTEPPVIPPVVVPTTPAVTVGNIKMVLDVELPNPAAPLDLSTSSPADRVSGISFTVNTAPSTLKLTGIESPNINMQIAKEIAISTTTATISVVNDLIGPELANGKTDISMAALRDIFGTSVTVKGTLEAEGFAAYTVSITVNLGSGDVAAVPTEWALFDILGTDVNAWITDGAAIPSQIGITNLLLDSVGVLPSEVSVDNTTWYSVATEKSAIANAIAGLAAPKTWSELTLADLIGNNIYFKKTGDAITVYTLKLKPNVI